VKDKTLVAVLAQRDMVSAASKTFALKELLVMKRDDAPVAIQKNRGRRVLHWWIIALIVVALVIWWIMGSPKAR